MKPFKPALICALALAFSTPTAFAQDSTSEEMTAEEILERLRAQRNRSLGFVKESEPAPTETENVSITEAKPALAQSEPQDGIEPAEVIEPVTIDLTIYFNFDSAVLQAKSISQLDALCFAIKSDTGAGTYNIIGHTDAKGKASYNQRLSRARADEVVRYMTGTCGIATNRLAPIGAGETELKTPNTPNAAENRRVEVQVTS